MSKIVASTYELIKEIGSGGGGVVYLARHCRLDKEVVLKADKRTLTTRPEVLRREVDALKNLRHSYIPQVYDFIAEDDTVYTVMDYVEGESLDKPLKRGERFSQSQVIRWACQILEALIYLHSRPPHGILHSDIKPANIMLTPQGDICLIDFNIALALGEQGAVRVGFSRGYASPEHYGIDYRKISETQDVTSYVKTQLSEEIAETMVSSHGETGSATGKKTILLDVRSDIYSLGATLYHLLTGIRPIPDPEHVAPIEPSMCSEAIIRIIRKAMELSPDQRYQTAEEMLDDFKLLHERDKRVCTLKKVQRTVLGGLLIAVICTGMATFTGLRRMEQHQTINSLTEYAFNALEDGNVNDAISLAVQALPEEGLFTPVYSAAAQKVLTDALGVYDLSDGFKVHNALQLPSEPMKVTYSPDGTKVAVFYAYEMGIYDLLTGECLGTIPMEPSALSDICFVDDSTVVYAGEGAVQCYDILHKKLLWSGEPATQMTLSSDGSRLATIYKDENCARIYEVKDGSFVKTVDFGTRQQRVLENDILADPNDDFLALNQNGTMLAASFSDGSVLVYDIENPLNDLIVFENSQYGHFEGGFYEDYLALSASAPDDSVFVIIDTKNVAQTGAFVDVKPFLVQTDESGIYLAHRDVLVKIHPVTGEQTEVAYTEGITITDFDRGGDYTVVATEDQNWWLFDKGTNCLAREVSEVTTDFVQVSDAFLSVGSINTPTLRLMAMERHEDAEIFSYNPTILHDEVRISADFKTVMFFDFQQFSIYDMNGTLITTVEIPNPDRVYDQQYRRDEEGSYLEVIYNNGYSAAYSAEDGLLFRETLGNPPDRTLYEEFYTENLKITAPLHETPVAYDKESGKKIRELEKDAYLTYVTQVGDYVVTEYLSSEGLRYGLLLNENCETLAYLPYLCDVVGDQLVFDYPSGNLRQSRLYSIEELLVLAN